MSKQVPTIFAPGRKQARRARAEVLSERGETARFLLEAMIEDILERMAFIRHTPELALLEGFAAPALSRHLPADCQVQILAQDFDIIADAPPAHFDTVVSISSLDRVNDLPGALIQMRELLKPGGLAMATFVGGQSLQRLRRAMHDAEAERPAARMHPLIDPRSCTELLGRAGWKDPVVDSYVLRVRYASLSRLVQDLREQALGNVLASQRPALTRKAAERAHAAFLAQADEDGKVTETFEIITLTGRR